jgi:hypothetical protein
MKWELVGPEQSNSVAIPWQFRGSHWVVGVGNKLCISSTWLAAFARGSQWEYGRPGLRHDTSDIAGVQDREARLSNASRRCRLRVTCGPSAGSPGSARP